MKRLITASAVAALAVAAALAGCAGAPAATTDTTLVIGAAGGAGTYDTGGDSWLYQTVYEGLVTSDPESGEYEPLLATDWSYDATRTVLTFRLREGVVFTDGTPFDAEAVATNLVYHRDHYLAFYLGRVERVDVLDESTAEVHLTEPDPNLFYGLRLVPMISPTALEDLDSLKSNPVGTGPYVLDSEDTVPDVEYVHTRNEDYWNPEGYPFDKIVVKVMPDVTARVNALISGQVDLAPIDAATAARVEGAGLHVASQRAGWVGIVLGDRNGTINPALADVRVRRAIAYAIDRDAIAQSVNLGYDAGGNQVFTEGQAEYRPDRADDYGYDPDEARRLLAEAGYPDGFDLVMPQEFTETYAPSVTQYLGDVGIRVRFESIPADKVVEAYLGDGYAAQVRYEYFAATLNQNIVRDGVWNGFHYITPEAQALLDRIATGSDADAAKARAQLGDLVLDEMWFAVIAQPLTLYGVATDLDVTLAKVGGLLPSISNIRPAR